MNLKQLKYVIVLSNCGSFSVAADELNISQPSLSQYIKNIEKELDIQLFDRTNGNVKLTDAGRIYIAAGKSILSIEHEMQNKFSDLNDFKAGTLSVGISPHRSFHLMPQYAAKFRKLYPNIKLIVEERSGTDLIESAQNGEFDLFITTLPLDNSVFSYKTILKEEIVLATPVDSKLYSSINGKIKTSNGKAFPVVDIKLINNNDFVTLSGYMPMKKIEMGLSNKYNLELNYVLECTSLESQIAMVHSGIASAIIPVTLSNFNDSSNKVAYFSFEQNIASRDIVVAWRSDHYLSKPAKKLIDIMKNQGQLN